MATPDAKIPVLGVGGDGAAGLTSRSRDLLAAADLVLGSDAALGLLPDLRAERYRIGAELQDVLDTIKANLGKKRMVVVATGDPLFYGVARYLCDKIGKDSFDVIPHVSSMQPGVARVKEWWEKAYLPDLGNRSLDDLLDRSRTSQTVGPLTKAR